MVMEDARLKKYRRKLGYIQDRIKVLQKDQPHNPFYWDALFYRLHTAIQALMDVIAMICKDTGYEVMDDSSNIDKLKALELISQKERANIKSLLNLRNDLVYRYNHIETELIETEKNRTIHTISEILAKLEGIIDEL